MKNPDIILAVMISAAIGGGFWMLKPPPPPPDISIHKAAGAGNIEAVKQHLAAGTAVNAKGESGSTPLFFAATKEIAELLIAKGADVNAKEEDGSTPLHQAAWESHKEIAELLIAEGADVNSVNGGTPLDWAIIRNHTETADLLRKHGGKTGKELKAAGKPTEPVAEAAKPEPPTAKTPLWKAAMFGEIEPAKQAIADGADVNAKGERGLTPLHFAVFAALDSWRQQSHRTAYCKWCGCECEG